jgi:apolipoprotein N-acyltransferase
LRRDHARLIALLRYISLVPFLRRHRALLLAVAGGVVFALTSPPTDLYPAVVVGLALLAASLGTSREGAAWPAPLGFWRAFGRAAAWGTAAGVIGLRFVPAVIQRFTPLGAAVSYLALVLLAAAQSLIWAIGAGVTSVLHRRARLPFELAFAAGVLVALCLPTIFAWSPAGLVSPWPTFVQLADVIGERGVSFLFAVGAALFARAAHIALSSNLRAAARPALAGAALFIALPAHGALRMRSIAAAPAGPTLRVGLVDQAVKPLERWNRANYPSILRTLRGLTRTLEAQGAELVVWPEAAYPYPIPHDATTAPDPHGHYAIVGNGVRGPVLAGLITEDPPVQRDGVQVRDVYNSATLVSPDGSLQPPYDKLELLWFGETVPGSAYIPWLRRTFQRSGGLVPGAEPRALVLPPRAGDGATARMAVLNCYEDTLPGLGRRLAVALAPNLLVNVTNDAWFYATAEPELHARLGAMRAIELRRDLVRAVNLGATSWIDAAGVVRAQYDAQAPGTLLVTPTLRDGGLTFYARFGDVPLFAMITAAAIVFSWRARRRPPAPVE